MTPDLAEIRQALAAYLDDDSNTAYKDRRHFEVNAPTWLAALCNELEWLRGGPELNVAETERLIAERDAALDEVERLRTALFGSADEFVILAPEDFKTLVAERAAALAECERLRADTQELNAGWTECAVERDAALAEVERLRLNAAPFLRNRIGELETEIERLNEDNATDVYQALAERDAALADLDIANQRGDVWREDAAQQADTALAWRACAEWLDEGLREALSYVPKHFVIKHAIGVEALAEYERLAGQNSEANS